jgi:hypothetical protein
MMMKFDAKQIDYRKLLAAVKARSIPRANRWGWEYPPDPTKGKWGPGLDDASLLYSIVAHTRGHLHADKKYMPLYDASGGTVLVARTMDDQEALIGRAWLYFARDELQAQLSALVGQETLPPGF